MALPSAWRPITVSGTTGRVDATPGDETASESIGRFGGYTLRNTSAAAVQVDFYDNTSSGTGTLLASIDLTAKGSVGAFATVVPADGGVRYDKGVYAVFSGAGVQGSIFLH